jgi:hypothetical protein
VLSNTQHTKNCFHANNLPNIVPMGFNVFISDFIPNIIIIIIIIIIIGGGGGGGGSSSSSSSSRSVVVVVVVGPGT